MSGGQGIERSSVGLRRTRRIHTHNGVSGRICFDGFKFEMTVRRNETGTACFTDP
mgnify:CR=1 FL=1